jgi:hypothetical protein
MQSIQDVMQFYVRYESLFHKRNAEIKANEIRWQVRSFWETNLTSEQLVA